MSEKRYFHEMKDLEWEYLKKIGETWDDVIENFKQPDWCDYPGALEGMMGCWSLVGRMVTGRDYCKDCDLCKPQQRDNPT